MVMSNLGNSEDNGIGTIDIWEQYKVFNLISTKLGTGNISVYLVRCVNNHIYKFHFRFLMNKNYNPLFRNVVSTDQSISKIIYTQIFYSKKL